MTDTEENGHDNGGRPETNAISEREERVPAKQILFRQSDEQKGRGPRRSIENYLAAMQRKPAKAETVEEADDHKNGRQRKKAPKNVSNDQAAKNRFPPK